MTADHLQRSILAAESAGFTHYASALRTLYKRLYGFETVTGAHFRRSMDWAKTAPRLRDLLPLPGIATSAARPSGTNPGPSVPNKSVQTCALQT